MARSALSLVLLGVGLCAGPVMANDIWEGLADDTFNGSNLLRHGVVQSNHDLQGAPPTPDQDWMRVVTKTRHSYEARVTGLYWDNGCAPPPCPLFDRVNMSGSVLTAGSVASDDANNGAIGLGRTVRWIATTGAQEYLRALGDQLQAMDTDPYDVVYYDTTLFVPRWNNTATQTTVLILQNTTNATVTGSIFFHNAGGTLLAETPVNVPQFGVQVIQTASNPALSGGSGSALIAQLGGYGALAGKAVALEPATGFTFDTAITPVPR
jgi:hypothetical protein